MKLSNPTPVPEGRFGALSKPSSSEFRRESVRLKACGPPGKKWPRREQRRVESFAHTPKALPRELELNLMLGRPEENLECLYPISGLAISPLARTVQQTRQRGCDQTNEHWCPEKLICTSWASAVAGIHGLPSHATWIWSTAKGPRNCTLPSNMEADRGVQDDSPSKGACWCQATKSPGTDVQGAG